MKRVFSGIQPTGSLHIGNHIGAIQQWVKMQHDHESLFCIVDLHSITVPFNPSELHQSIRLVAATYIACGINPQESIIFQQSRVPFHAELSWVLGCMTPLGWLNRMTQFKDKAGKHKEQASLGLYGYPVLQAADILLYQTNIVPVGDDQKQHIELCRDIAISFNSRFKTEFFTVPEPQIMKTSSRIMSLRDGTSKMSKSDPSEYSRILLTDSADEISAKIRKAKTDADVIAGTFEEMNHRPEAQNLISIYSAYSEEDLHTVCERYAGAQFSKLKQELSDLLVAKITPIGQEIEKLMDDRHELDKILEEGGQRAHSIASTTWIQVKDLLGMGKI